MEARIARTRLRRDGRGPGDRARRLHGRRQVDRRAHGSLPSWASSRSTPTASSSAELGEPIESFFDREGEARVPRARGGGRAASCSGRRRRARGRAGRRRARAPSACARRLPSTRSCTSRSTPRTPGGAPPGSGRPLARDRGRFEQLHGRPPSRSTTRSPTPSCPRATAASPCGPLPALRALRRGARGARGWCWARSESGDYPVFFGRGPDRRPASSIPRDGRRFVVTDANVAAPASGGRRGARSWCSRRGGEDAGRAPRRCCARLAAAGAERGDRVVAVGGGVVGDLAGFCAAVYQRGMRHVQVPTTLVAQVDSAYGGKTGVDLPEGKNYAGAYHQPSAVLCDPDRARDAPARGAGRGLRRGGEDRADRRRAAVGARAPGRPRGPRRGDRAARARSSRVVAEDERDGGRRQVLNLGPHRGPRHRVGHRLLPLPPRRGGGDRAAGGAAAVRAATRCAPRWPTLLGARGLPLAFEGASVDDVVALVRARQEAARAARARSCCVRGAGRGHARARGGRRPTCAPRSRRCTRREEPGRGAARREPRRARARGPRALRRRSRSPSSRCA